MEKSLNLGKIITNHKMSLICFSGKEDRSMWTVLHCSFEEVWVKCWAHTPDPWMTPEHGDIVTVLIHNYYYLQTVNTRSDCLLPLTEFGLWLSLKANQGPTIIITLTRYWNLIVCLLLSYLVWILISVVGCSVNGSTINFFGSSYKACYTRLILVIAHFLFLNLLYRMLMHVITLCPLLNLVCGWPLKLTKVHEGLP